MSWHEIIFGIIVGGYVALWIADLWCAPSREARNRILLDAAETFVIAIIVGTFVWWLL